MFKMILFMLNRTLNLIKNTSRNYFTHLYINFSKKNLSEIAYFTEGIVFGVVLGLIIFMVTQLLHIVLSTSARYKERYFCCTLYRYIVNTEEMKAQLQVSR